MSRLIVHVAALVALVTFAAGCARAVSVGTGGGPVYPVEVRNTLAEDMIVSYDDGSGTRTLGTVRTGGTERFIIAAPGNLNISISARNADGTETSGPYSVQLAVSETAMVTLR